MSGAAQRVTEHADVAQWAMLATAIAGRSLSVAPTTAPQLPCSNGATIFIDAQATTATRLQQLCVQSALLAAGSLDAGLVRALRRRPESAQRYLALEGWRALHCVAELLPPSLHALLAGAPSALPSSADESLRIALSKATLAEAPPVFGAIDVRSILAAQSSAPPGTAHGRHAPRSASRQPLRELPDEAAHVDDDEDVAGSPVGGGGPIGRFLQSLMQMTRRIRDGGPPGADAPTHWSRSGARPRVRALSSTASAEDIAARLADVGTSRYPEWDVHAQCYRTDWCEVSETEAPLDHQASVEWLSGYGLRRPLARLGMGLDRFRHRAQGDDIDIDAVIAARIDRRAGRTPDEQAYIESLRRRRDLSVLVLLDISGSAAQVDAGGCSVHERQRRVAAELLTVLYELGDRVALYAFHSQGRAAVHLLPVKRFDDELDGLVMRRLHSLVPGAYSRLGAAIRHAGTRLIEQGGTSRRLLLLLSDGLAYDHGYEPAYGAADAKQALAEARRDGVACLCLSVGASTDSESLCRVFGSAAHASVADGTDLGPLIGGLFHAALKNSEVRRRAA
jgi:nitric oxide reductase NorD protein